MIAVHRNTAATQAAHCRLCIHVGSWAWYFGNKPNGFGARLELATPLHWFRYSKGTS
jgi:hypothetical protein